MQIMKANSIFQTFLERSSYPTEKLTIIETGSALQFGVSYSYGDRFLFTRGQAHAGCLSPPFTYYLNNSSSMV